jgi:hypothetical protein
LASEIVDELSGRRATAAVVLPDLAVASAVFSPSTGGSESDRRLDLGRRLGVAPSEARSDFWTGRKGEVLGAAVREAVVRQYEQVVEAAECRLGWIDAASLVRIPVWAEASASEPEAALVRAQLYGAHYVLALFRGGELVDVRTRLRSGNDADAVAAEILRLPAIYGVTAVRAVILSGEGASACARLISESWSEVQSFSEDEGEQVLLEKALSTILERS